jgi:hypothetical protein
VFGERLILHADHFAHHIRALASISLLAAPRLKVRPLRMTGETPAESRFFVLGLAGRQLERH